MFIRSTTQSTNGLMLDYILQNQSKYNELSMQIATQKKLNVPSDNPVDAISVLNTNKELNQLNGYLTSMSTAQNELNVADNTLASITSSLQKASEFAVQASNGTNTSSSLSSVKTQIDQIIQNVVSLGNTQFNGSYLFSGTDTSTKPFSDIATGGVQYNGNSQGRTAQVSEGVSVTVNVSGSKLLGSYDVANPASPTNSGVLKTLYEFSAALGAASTVTAGHPIPTAADFDSIRTNIDKIKKDIDNNSSIRTDLASVTNRFKMTESSINSSILQLKTYKSGLEDLDLSQAATDLATQETALKATMAVASKTLGQTSLLDFM